MVECLRNGNWYSKPPLGYDKLKVGREHVLTVNEKARYCVMLLSGKQQRGLKI